MYLLYVPLVAVTHFIAKAIHLALNSSHFYILMTSSSITKLLCKIGHWILKLIYNFLKSFPTFHEP